MIGAPIGVCHPLPPPLSNVRFLTLGDWPGGGEAKLRNFVVYHRIMISWFDVGWIMVLWALRGFLVGLGLRSDNCESQALAQPLATVFSRARYDAAWGKNHIARDFLGSTGREKALGHFGHWSGYATVLFWREGGGFCFLIDTFEIGGSQNFADRSEFAHTASPGMGGRGVNFVCSDI